MKLTTGDWVTVAIAITGAVGFYLERAVWDAHGWSRNGLGLLIIGFWAAVYLAYLMWRLWRQRNSN